MDGIAARRFSLSGRTFEPGEAVTFPDNQFRDLAGCGLVENKPAAARVPKPLRKRG